MVTCRWQVRLAFLCVSSCLCACRVLHGVAVEGGFLFLSVILRGVSVLGPRCKFGSSWGLACRFDKKLDKVAWAFGRRFRLLCSGSVAVSFI